MTGLPPVAALADRFSLGTVTACVPVTEGLMNPNWRLTGTAGTFAVKQLRDAAPADVRRQSRLLPRLADAGLPVPRPRETRDGDPLARIGGDWYAVAGWLPGAHRDTTGLSLSACHRLGRLLGEIHATLRSLLPAAPGTVADEPASVGGTVTTLARYARAAAAGPDDFDRYAAAEIAWRLRHLRSVAHLRPQSTSSVRPAGWTHGDINRLNLLFSGERVAGVLDWDRLGVRPYGLEVVRSAVLLFDQGDGAGPDLPRLAAFTAGYRARHPIGADALRDAAHRRWWQLTCDAWFLKLHYDRGSTACDHLLRTQGLFLRWWTPNRDIFDQALLG